MDVNQSYNGNHFATYVYMVVYICMYTYIPPVHVQHMYICVYLIVMLDTKLRQCYAA